MSFDAIERRKIVAESFLLFKRSMASGPLKKCYGFFSESLFGLKNIKNLGAIFSRINPILFGGWGKYYTCRSVFDNPKNKYEYVYKLIFISLNFEKLMKFWH